MTSYISGSLSPGQSLGLELQVTAGRNQIQRQVGNYSALYQATGANIQDVYVEIKSLGIWSSNIQETYQRLVVSCSGVLVLNAVRADNTQIELEINRMLVLDSELKAFSLTNVNTEDVRANLHFVTTRPT